MEKVAAQHLARPQVERARREALQLLEDGDLDGARLLLQTAREPLRADREQYARAEAALLADEAKIDGLELRDVAAADKHEESLRLEEEYAPPPAVEAPPLKSAPPPARPVEAAQPSGAVSRVRANLAALRTLQELQAHGRAPTEAERAKLAQWSAWGATPAVFNPSDTRFAEARQELKTLLTPEEYRAAERTVLNAHYTDPAYVRAIWEAVRDLGFEEGRVLEPGCGSGTFVAYAPEGASVTGVELDPITAAIAATVHPHAEIRAESFADTRFADGAFDLVVGNVPFADVVLHDPEHNRGGHSIHNHFVIKSLRLTRPGGLVALITSRYSLDAQNPAARREMAELADLVGAVRLPTGAHRRTAGTDVVTDLLILRRREPGRELAGASFERSEPFEDGSALAGLSVNEYFLEHPDHVLGQLRATQGERGRLELDVVGDRAAGPALSDALRAISAEALDQGLDLSERAAEPSEQAPELPPTRPEGYLRAVAPGRFTRVVEGREQAYEPPASQAAELGALLALRDGVLKLLDLEAGTTTDTDEIRELRALLSECHDNYIARYGALNRFTPRRTGRVDPATGEDKWARITPPQGGFRKDPYCRVVYALEHFDEGSQRASKAAILNGRVIAQRAPRLGADSAEDALAICLDSCGEARLAEIARLLGTSPDKARAALGTLVFDEPGSDRIVPAPEYLSGNVRAKLAAARSALEESARYAPNVEALIAVQPRELGPDRITPQLGASWIEAQYVEQFLRETLEDSSVRVEHPGGSLWGVSSKNPRSVSATMQWGTDRYSAIALVQDMLEQRPIQVYDMVEVEIDGRRTERRVLNADATTAAAEKASELAARFAEWSWEDPARAQALVRSYNDKLNAYVLRSYDGARLSLPGLSTKFAPRPHQLAAVARIIHEPSVGLFHVVGAGKTAEMIIAAMELRRLGLVGKPAVIVPNHMLEQFANEWQQLYPQAKLLAATKDDLTRDQRQLFAARCATGDWDAVIMTRSAFERLPLSVEAQRAYTSRELAEIDTMLEAMRGSAGMTVKRLQKRRLKTEQRIKKELEALAASKDTGISLEQCGIDYFFVDEAHGYKNLMTFSHIPGMSIDGARRSSDLHMKIEYLRTRFKRVATLATATPIANSIGEVYTMLRYLRPDLLESAGIRGFDDWAATFGETVTFVEVAPDGSGMRLQSRFARFRNAAELLRWFAIAGDIKTAEDLQLPVPALAPRPGDGQRAPEVVVVPPSPELQDFMMEIAHRADRIRGRRVSQTVDNMLKISTDGRMAALDLRMVGLSTTAPAKLDHAAERIARTFERFRDARYHGADGSQQPLPGALQLVFADIGTPKPGEWSVYEELRSRLVERGIPRSAVRFIQEAKGDQAKAKLFAACREGSVSVLVGSTEGMGVGTNVQRRAVALHHLDCPWRPADLAQREGRIVRQGNENPEVQILRYVTERSFDGYTWQTVARKAESFNALLRGRLEDVREVEELGDSVLSVNEAKALATGNPLLLEQAQAQAEVTRLERLERAHRHAQRMLSDRVQTAAYELERHTQRAAQLARAEAADTLRDAPAAPFSAIVGGRSYDKRTEADERGREMIRDVIELARVRPATVHARALGTLRGFTFAVTPSGGGFATLFLLDVPGSDVLLSAEDVEKAAFMQRLENKLSRVPQLRQQAELDIQRVEADAERAQAEIGKPFRQADDLVAARTRLDALQDEIAHSARVLAAPAPQLPQPLTEEGREVRPEPLPLPELVAQMQKDHGVPARPLPLQRPVEGRLVLAELGPEGQPRAVVVAAEALYVVTACAPQIAQHVGQTVAVVKSAEGVRITASAPERSQLTPPTVSAVPAVHHLVPRENAGSVRNDSALAAIDPVGTPARSRVE